MLKEENNNEDTNEYSDNDLVVDGSYDDMASYYDPDTSAYDEAPLGEDEYSEDDKITLSRYIEEKKNECCNVENFDEAAWHMLRSQINSAVQLQIPLTDIDIFARPDLSYEQREILKYALYDMQGLEREYISELAEKKYSASELKILLNDKKIEVKMNETVSVPLQILSDTITTYKEDIDSFKANALRKEREYGTRIEELEDLLKKKTEEYELLKNTYEEEQKARIKKEEQDRQQKLMDEKIERLAEEKFAKLQLEKAAEQERLELERRKWEAEHMQQNNSIFGRKKRNKSADSKAEPKQVPDYKVKPLPKDFDLATYMMTAGLSTGQMEVITLAVKANVDDSQIKAMIDQNMPAQQMRQALAVILARSYRNSGVMGEGDIVYED